MKRMLLAGVATGAAVGVGTLFAVTAGAATTSYEAEAATLAGGARVAACTACAGGQKVGYVGNASGTLTFDGIPADVAGSATLTIAYASGSPRSAELRVNEGAATLISFPATGGWGTPGTLEVPVSLVAGSNTLTFGNSGDWAPDFDRLTVTTAGPASPAPTDPVSPSPSDSVPATVPPSASPGDSAPVTASPSAPVTASPTDSAPVTAAPTLSPSMAPPVTASPSAPVTAAPSPAPTGNAALEAQVVILINAERARVGCGPLAVNERLTAAARGHSADMAARGYFAHTAPDGGVDFSTRITRAGYTWSSAAENIAMGYRDAEAAVIGWINSPGHLRNIHTCGYRETGVGVVNNANGTPYWTQVFASPR